MNPEILSKLEPGQRLSLNIIFKSLAYNNSGSQSLQGDIPLLLPSGSYKYPELDIWNGKTEQGNEIMSWITNWLYKTEILTENTPMEKTNEIIAKAKSYSIGSTFLIPSLEPSNDKLKLLMRFCTLTSIIQELFPTAHEKMDGDYKLTKDNAIKLQGLLLGGEIIEGKITKIDDLPKSIKIPLEFKQIMDGFFSIANDAREIIFDFQNLCKPLSNKTNEIFAGIGIFATHRFLKPISLIPESTFKYVHTLSTGCCSLIEMSCLVAGISLTDTVRNHALFRKVLDLAATITDYLLDIFGLANAIEQTQTKQSSEHEEALMFASIILYKMKVDDKLTLKEAFNSHVAELRDCIHNFAEGCKILRKTNPKNKRMDKFLSVLENFIDGNIYWLGGVNNIMNDGKFTTTLAVMK